MSDKRFDVFLFYASVDYPWVRILLAKRLRCGQDARAPSPPSSQNPLSRIRTAAAKRAVRAIRL